MLPNNLALKVGSQQVYSQSAAKENALKVNPQKEVLSKWMNVPHMYCQSVAKKSSQSVAKGICFQSVARNLLSQKIALSKWRHKHALKMLPS